MTKLLVGLGSTKEGTVSIEIIDLESPSKTCQNLPRFPLALEGPFGGLGFLDKPMICGGTDRHSETTDDCYSLEGNQWTYSNSLNTERYGAAVSPSLYPSQSHKFFVTGGFDDLGHQLNTVEVLTEKGWETLPKTLPVTIYNHCSLLYNSTAIMLIGGSQNGAIAPKTYFINNENKMWTEGPQLQSKRWGHACGRIRKDSDSQELSIIVAGGYDADSKFSSVEILDLGSNEWRKGPEIPFGIQEAAMVEDQNGGVVIVGGSSSSILYLDTLYQLPHGGEDATWTQMEQKLKLGRSNHVAFLVSDNIVDCSNN
jgi:hypothetical protein